MSKAEKYIREHTRNAVNHITENFPWITTNDAKKAVEIAREETIDKIKQLFEEKYLIKSTEPLRWVSWEKVFSDLKQAMK